MRRFFGGVFFLFMRVRVYVYVYGVAAGRGRGSNSGNLVICLFSLLFGSTLLSHAGTMLIPVVVVFAVLFLNRHWFFCDFCGDFGRAKMDVQMSNDAKV